MTTMNEAVGALFPRAGLPERIRVKRDYYVIKAGDTLVWREGEGYIPVGGSGASFVFYPFIVRKLWSVVFENYQEARVA